MVGELTEPGVDAADFRSLMAGFPSGVAVVTTVGELGQPTGMTCSSLCSVSVDPPTLLVCLRSGSPTLQAVLQSQTFAVNVLHSGARPTAELFASGAKDRFDRIHWIAPSEGGEPRLGDDARATADCQVSRTEVVNDHVVVFGEVVRVVNLSARPPLLYGLRRYAGWPES